MEYTEEDFKEEVEEKKEELVPQTAFQQWKSKYIVTYPPNRIWAAADICWKFVFWLFIILVVQGVLLSVI